MAFDPSVFWSAFVSAGMLKEATVSIGGQPRPPIMVGFQAPDVFEMDGMVQSTDYTIEYQTADLPGLRPGDTAVIDGITYRCKLPRQRGDGYFSIVELEKVKS